MTEKENVKKKRCKMCFTIKEVSEFACTPSPFFKDGYSDICYSCAAEHIDIRDLRTMEAYCRYVGIAFLPDEWLNIASKQEEQNLKNVDLLRRYFEAFAGVADRGLDWKEVNDKWARYLDKNYASGEISLLRGEKMQEFKKKWITDYTYDQYVWLEDYYQGMLESYNVKTESHRDYLRKICKLSLEMDLALSRGEDISKLSNAYDKLMSSAKFTEADRKNSGAISSVGEIIAYIEKRGYMPHFYDGKDRDEVDVTISNLQEYTRNLVLGEPTLQDIVQTRLEKKKEAELNDKKMGVSKDKVAAERSKSEDNSLDFLEELD